MNIKLEIEGFSSEEASKVKLAIYELVSGMYPNASGSIVDMGGKPEAVPGSVSYAHLGTAITGYAIDPLESAIELIVRMMDERMASDRSPSINVGSMLMGHLEELLAEQLRRVTDPDRDATLVSHIKEMRRDLRALVEFARASATVEV